jgi:hypothetical protein
MTVVSLLPPAVIASGPPLSVWHTGLTASPELLVISFVIESDDVATLEDLERWRPQILVTAEAGDSVSLRSGVASSAGPKRLVILRLGVNRFRDQRGRLIVRDEATGIDWSENFEAQASPPAPDGTVQL